MEFSFPQYFSVVGGVLKKVNERRFLPIDVSKPLENAISINKTDYFFIPLSEQGNKGENSIILKLYESQEFDINEINYGIPDKVLKISKFNLASQVTKSNKRFQREIDALKHCSGSGHQNIITIYEDGICKIYDANKGKYLSHQFYTMEFAKYDLKSYVESNHNILGLEEKLELCLSLSEGLKELNQLGYYHRDLKPDNIFITEDDKWKIGDLGLIQNRQVESIDKVAEFVGPKGWMSPEAMNKFLCEGKGFSFKHSCTIDHQSDIFQLGKVFWYIFQYNVPIGSVKESDFLIKNNMLFSIIKTMLNHSKKRRYKDIDEVIHLLKPLETKLLKTA